ncbi:helix-turn-helix domain-containing protein [Streptomyces sp. NPDC060064]|uniref:helix-turn-helix domain-containing protein n=1 Tax=Streptomyces sp. NPDC060064 TaxID=3347049 RepID=UPI0036B59B02
MIEFSVSEAAASLGVSRQRVLALIHDGDLPARLIGGRWVVLSADVDEWGQDRPAGRPMAGRVAWGLLDLLDDGRAPWLKASERSRLRARLRARPSIAQVGHWVRRRNEVLWLRGHPAALPRLLAFEGAVPAGASAPGQDIVDPGQVEVYLRQDAAARAMRKLALRQVPRREANAVVKVPQEVWPFDDGPGRAAVALDLWDASDERSRRTARRLYSSVLDARFPALEGDEQ